LRWRRGALGCSTPTCSTAIRWGIASALGFRGLAEAWLEGEESRPDLKISEWNRLGAKI
jgi:hypothetical protein